MDARLSDYISENKPRLLELTSCTTELLVRLKSSGIFSTEEKQSLECMLTNNGNTKAVDRIYELLTTRTNVYDIFVNILRDLRQSGAVSILEVAANKCEDLILDVLTNCLINGENTTLRTALGQLTTEDAKKILANQNIVDYFRTFMTSVRPVLCVNGNLRDNNPLYMERNLSNRLTIDPKIFKRKDCKDVFIVKGISPTEFAEIVEPNNTCKLKSQLQRRKLRHIYLEKDDRDTDWTLLPDASKVPIHFIIKEGAKFVLQVSNQITPILRENASSKKEMNSYITEEEFLSKLQSDVESGVCVCDIAGMGKSWLFENLARALRNRDSFVFLLSLPKLSKKYMELKIDFCPGDNLKFILQHACEQNRPKEKSTETLEGANTAGARLSAELLSYYVKKYRRKLYFFLDGFDEVPEAYVDAVKILLNEVKNEGGASVKLCIASRPHKRIELEETFNLIAYDILPFGKEEQVTALMKKWDIKLELNQDRLRKFADQCIKSCEKLQGSAKRNFLGVPLKIHMLAEINLKTAKYCADKTRKLFPLSNDAPIASVCDLFDKYVASALERVSDLCGESKRKSNWKTDLLNFHTLKAMEALQLENNVVEEFKRVTLIDEYTEYKMIHDLGLLYHNGINYKFTHRSFAEYFVGKFFAEYWTVKSSMQSKLFGEYFLSTVLETVIKRFIHLDCLNKNWKNVLFCETSFVKESILWFVNNLLNLKPEAAICGLEGFENSINCKIYTVILACIEEDFVPIMDLLIELKKYVKNGSFLHIFEAPKESFYLKNEEGTPFNGDVAKREKETWLEANLKPASVAYLLLVLAQKGSIDIGNSVFELFALVGEDEIQHICTNLPQTWKSPVESVIRRNDIDMTNLFLTNKQNLNLDGIKIFIICLKGHNMTETDVIKRQEIVRKVNKIYKIMSLQGNRQSIVKSIEELADEPFDYNLDILKWTYNDYKLNWSLTSAQFKTWIVRDILINSALTDENLVDLLIVMFGFKRKNPQESINIEEIQNVFKSTADISNWFAHLNKISTLKILVRLFDDFSQYNSEGKTLLHFSVQHGKLHWVKHLLSEGFDVNKPDAKNNSPLLCISSKNSIDITNILSDKGGDMHAINNERRNVAHTMVYSVHHTEYLQWFNHVLTTGPPKLWTRQDQDGKTPVDLMTEEWGEGNPSRREILFEMQKFKAIDFKYQSK